MNFRAGGPSIAHPGSVHRRARPDARVISSTLSLEELPWPKIIIISWG